MRSGVFSTSLWLAIHDDHSTTWRRWHPYLLDGALVALLGLGTVALHVWVPGVVPSGGDPGNWLALAREMLGEDVMSADVSYPPGFVALVAALLLVLAPLPAIVVGGVVAKTLLVVTIYLCARPAGRLPALVGGLIAGVAGAQVEAYAWGAYPQILGTALGFAAVFLVVRFLDTRRPWSLIVAVGLATLAAFTHLMVAGLLVFAVPVAIIFWLLTDGARFRDWYRVWWVVALVILPSTLFVGASYLLSAEGTEPVINPLGLDRAEVVTELIREAPALWVIVAAFGIGALLAVRWEGRRAWSAATGVSWTIAGIGFFASTGESRALLIAQLGLTLLAVTSFERAYHWVRSRVGGRGRIVSRAMIVLGVSVVSGLAVGGVTAHSAATDWYRVVDEESLETLDTLRGVAEPGDLAISSQGHNGNPLGWWVEGYAGVPTYSGIDSEWLAYQDERAQAEVARRLFTSSPDEAARIMREVGARFLVVDTLGPDRGWAVGVTPAELSRHGEGEMLAYSIAE